MGEVSTTRVVIGKPQTSQSMEIGGPLTEEHQKAVEEARGICQKGVDRCEIMPFTLSQLELRTKALGAFCIDGCPTLQRFSEQ